MKFIKFGFGDAEYHMAIPDDQLSQNCAVEVINGYSYPFLTEFAPPAVVVDIGGHAGEYSAMAALNWPLANVVCFEPNPQLMECLTINAATFGFNVIPAAVSPLNNPTDNSWLRVSEMGSVMNSMLVQGEQTGEVIQVKQVSNELVNSFAPEVIKIDTEGMEYDILNALELDGVRLIYLEFHSEHDRLRLDKLLMPTHKLAWGRIQGENLGELMYIRRE